MTKKEEHSTDGLYDGLRDVQGAIRSHTQDRAAMNAALTRLNETLFREIGTTRVAWVVQTRPTIDRDIGDVIGIALFTANRRIAENPAILWTTVTREAFEYIFEQRGFDVLPHRDRCGNRPSEQRARVPMALFEVGWGVKFTTVLP